jgi:hypothetical protein
LNEFRSCFIRPRVAASALDVLERRVTAMPIGNFRVVTTAALMLGTLGLGAAGIIIYLAGFASPKEDNQPPSSRQGPIARIHPEQTVHHGTVLDEGDKPLAGARLLLQGTTAAPIELGNSDAAGRFSFVLPKDGNGQYLIAWHDGSGLDVIKLRPKMPVDIGQLRLVRDRLIRGRLINTEGQPVAGAKVSVTQLSIFADNSLDTFLGNWLTRQVQTVMPQPVKNLVLEPVAYLSATTDAGGQFTIAGTGAERFVELSICGAGIAESKLWVANRADLDARPYNKAADDFRSTMPLGIGPKYLMYGPDLAVVAEFERRIRGVVKDIDTGKPRGGVKVWLSRDGDEILPVQLVATGDSSGNYEIRGAGKGSSYILHVASDPAAAYMARQVEVPDPPGYDPITVDIGVKKGVMLTGRVIDTSTGEPLPGLVMVGVLAANKLANDYPEFGFSSGVLATADDGSFKLVTIPGKVLLMGGPDPKRMPERELATYRYKPARPDPRFPDYFDYQHDVTGYFRPKAAFSPLHGQFCKVLDIDPNAAVVSQDVLLERASMLTIRIEDPQGRPLGGSWVTGMSALESWQRPLQIKGDACPVFHLEPGKPRLMVFYAPSAKLVGTITLKGEEKSAAVARLGMSGSATGRLIGADGKPLAGVTISHYFLDRAAEEANKFIHRAKAVRSNTEGIFKIDEVIPGPRFSLWFTQGRRVFEPLTKLEERSVKAGEPLDFGEIKLKLKAED